MSRALARRAALALVGRSLRRTPPRPAERLLLIRPDHLGDTLLLTPALRALRAARPSAEITVLVGPWSAAALAGNPDVDRVETLPFPYFSRQPATSPLAPYRLLYREAERLRGRYDAALICRFDHGWGAWLARAAAIPRVIGYATPETRPFLTEALPYPPNRHEAVQTLALLAGLGVAAPFDPARLPLRYEGSAEGDRQAGALLAGLPTEGPLVALHPGSGAPVKQWAGARWGELMAALHESHGARFIVTGGPGDREAVAALLAASTQPVRSLAEQTPLPALAALYDRCALVIGPDSGPLHLAVARGRPTVHLYGPVDPARFGPWGDPARHQVVTQALACQFCNRLDWAPEALGAHPCTTGIPTAWVAAAARRGLAMDGGGGSRRR